MNQSLLRNLASGLSGFYADFVALFLAGCCILFIFAQFLQVLPVTNAGLFPAPLPLALSAVALWTSTSTSPVFHQHLTMLPFLLACFVRFAGTWTHDPHSAHSLLTRIFSRSSEYTMLYCAFSQPSTCNALYALPLVVLLATARSNEILRAWKSDQRKTCTERHQIVEALVWLETHMEARDHRLPISRPQAQPQPPQQQPQSQSQSHQLQVQLQPQPQNQFANEPQFRRRDSKPNNCAFQLGYLWIDGSGTLVTATTMIFFSSFIFLVQSKSPIYFLSVSVSVIYALSIFYLWLQCLPGLFVRMNKNFPKLMENIPRSWFDNPVLWAQDWFSLLKDVANWTSSPFRCQELPKFIQLPLCYVEASELFIHVLIAVISRLTLHALVLAFMCILKVTRITFTMHHLQSPLIWFMTHYSKPELQLIRDHFLDNQKHYVLLGLSFEQMDTYSTVLIHKNTYGTSNLPSTTSRETVRILKGYCPVTANGEQIFGYGRLRGVFVDLEEIFSKIEDRSHVKAVVGGWVTTKDPRAESWVVVNRWGNAEPDPKGGDCCVAHVYQGIHHTKIWEGNTPGEMKVYVKWGSVQDAIVITHIWQDNQLILGLFDWAPPLKDVTVYAYDVTSFPERTTWRLAWRRMERFFLL